MRTADEYLQITGILIPGLKEINEGQLYKRVRQAINLAMVESIKECAERASVLTAPKNYGYFLPSEMKNEILSLIDQVK